MECKMTQEELVRGLLERKEEAFRCLYIQCFHLCRNFITNNGGTFEDAQDIFQDAIVALLEGNTLNKYQTNVQAKVSTLLITIVRNKWLNRLRSNKKYQWVELDDTLRVHSIPEEPELLGEEPIDLVMAYQECMKSLKEICQKVILMTYFHKNTDKEIAETFSWETSYVKVRRFRCIEELRLCANKSVA